MKKTGATYKKYDKAQQDQNDMVILFGILLVCGMSIVGFLG